MILYLDDRYSLETGFWQFKYSRGSKSVQVFSLQCFLHMVYPFWIALRVLRLDITSAFCNEHGFGFWGMGKLYFYDIENKSWKVKKGFKSKRPLKIDSDEEFVFFGDYFANSDRGKMGVYKYAFNENTLIKIHSFYGIRHVHCVKILSDDEMVVLCGDYEEEARMTFMDKKGNVTFELTGKDQLARSVDCYKDGAYLYYGMDTQLEQNYLCRYSLKEKKIERLQKVEGPVFNIWPHSAHVIGLTVSCEVGLDNIDTISVCTYNLKTKKLSRRHSYTMPVKLNKFIQKVFGVPTFDIYRNNRKMIVGTKYYFNIFRKFISLKI